MIICAFNCLYNSLIYILTSLYFTVSFLHTVLPFGLDIGLVGVSAYYFTKLRKPNLDNVNNIFGPLPGTRESEQFPEKTVNCIAHRGAALDAPENSMEAFKYCVDHNCNFVELDVRTSRDGRLILLHDQGLERLAGDTVINDVRIMDWDSIKNIDVGATHPNRQKYKEVHLCLLEDALDFLLSNKVKIIIDVKGEDKEVIEGVLHMYQSKPELYQLGAVTCFNPFVLYQIRKKDPEIVGAISYRPYVFSAQDYDAESGPTNPRYGENIVVHALLRCCDGLYDSMWRWMARWCNVSAVLLHKDIVSPSEVQYWRSLGIRCAGWCVNRPLEKLYWRGVLKAPYLAKTLLGEPDMDRHREETFDRADELVDKILESAPRRRMSDTQ